MVEKSTDKRSKMSTTMNTIGLCKMKENILETIINWLLLFNHNFVVNASAPLCSMVPFLCSRISLHPKTTKTGMAGIYEKGPLDPNSTLGADAVAVCRHEQACQHPSPCLLYTSDAADELDGVDL
eukprot:10838738-Ditylum_brightwellii.AAC.1